MNTVSFILVGLLVIVQADLWFGKSNLPHVASQHKELQAQLLLNEQARERNTRMAAEVSDLIEGEEIVEEKARSELGMVRRDEILIRVMPAR